MLEKTFCHIEGITPNSEKLLWESGITHWDHFFDQYELISCVPKRKLERIKEELPQSKIALQNNDLNYFKNTIPPKEHWRISHLGRIAYVDIETTGGSKSSSDITVIGIYDGKTPHMYIQGKNLDEAHAKLLEFEIVVTFNGKLFDLPFIEYYFCHQYNFVHLDLRFMLRELGLSGGLKSIEKQLGIRRDEEVEGVDGFEAVRLWYQYKRGAQAALDKLIKYNQEDIVNLKTLLEYFLITKREKLQEIYSLSFSP
jgi:hypothetical protein